MVLPRHMTAEICAASSFKEKYRCPEECNLKLEISPVIERIPIPSNNDLIVPVIWLTVSGFFSIWISYISLLIKTNYEF
jgi:hypothetical protein